MLSRTCTAARRALLDLASNEALFLFVAFVTQAILPMDPFKWYQESVAQISSLVVAPWGAALCLLRLERRARDVSRAERADLLVLFALLAWVTVPFLLRFGVTFNTANSIYNHAVVFFGVYAMITEEDRARRERLLDWACALFAALSAVLAVPMLWCVATVQSLGEGIGTYAFGLSEDGMLQFGVYYNSTGMVAQCCALFSWLGACRRKHPLAKLLHLLPALAMTAAVVLTQSRTSRCALLGAIAVGAFGYATAALPVRRRPARCALALLVSLLVFAGGFIGAQAATDAALAHYAAVRTARLAAEQSATDAADAPDAGQGEAQDGQPPEATEAEEPAPDAVAPSAARESTDSSLSDRTKLWRNLFDLWRENPRHMVIGNGMGNTGRFIVHGTRNEFLGAAAVHNTYLQFIADYGLIGFALMLAFLCMLAPAAFRALFAPPERAVPGDRVLVMLAVCQLLTGLMESQPLGAMSATNLALFFALAMLRARDADGRRALVSRSGDVL